MALAKGLRDWWILGKSRKVLYKSGVWFVMVLLCSTYQCVIRWWNLWFCHWGLVLDSMFLWLMTCFYRIVHNAHCHIVVCCVFMPQPLKKKNAEGTVSLVIGSDTSTITSMTMASMLLWRASQQSCASVSWPLYQGCPIQHIVLLRVVDFDWFGRSARADVPSADSEHMRVWNMN